MVPISRWLGGGECKGHLSALYVSRKCTYFMSQSPSNYKDEGRDLCMYLLIICVMMYIWVFVTANRINMGEVTSRGGSFVFGAGWRSDQRFEGSATTYNLHGIS